MKNSGWLIIFCVVVLVACNAYPEQVFTYEATSPTPNKTHVTLVGPTSYPMVDPMESTAYPPATILSSPTQTIELTATKTFMPPPIPITPSNEPMTTPLVPFMQLDALTLIAGNTGWAMPRYYTPSNAEPPYRIELKIIRTSNGLQDWQDVSPALPVVGAPAKAFFLDANTTMVFYYHSFMPDQVATELTSVRTLDGGRTWQQGETMHFPCCLRFPHQIEMVDADHGWMYASDQGSMGTAPISFYRTDNGGLSWEKVYDSNEQASNDPQNWMYSVSNPFGGSGFTLLDFDTALYATGRLFRSEDGGKSWQSVSIPIPPATSDAETRAGLGQKEPFVTVPQFWTKTDGVIVGRYYAEGTLNFPKPTTVPAYEYLYYTHDGGKTWTYRPSPLRSGRPFFLDGSNGWYLGKSDLDPNAPTQLFQTRDSGQTWELILDDCPLPLRSEIHFVGENVGYAFPAFSTYDSLFDTRPGPGASKFFFTQDGGHTWQQVEPAISP